MFNYREEPKCESKSRLTFNAADSPQPRVGEIALFGFELWLGLVCGGIGAVADVRPWIEPVVRADGDGHQAEGSKSPHGGQQGLNPALTPTHGASCSSTLSRVRHALAGARQDAEASVILSGLGCVRSLCSSPRKKLSPVKEQAGVLSETLTWCSKTTSYSCDCERTLSRESMMVWSAQLINWEHFVCPFPPLYLHLSQKSFLRFRHGLCRCLKSTRQWL